MASYPLSSALLILIFSLTLRFSTYPSKFFPQAVFSITDPNPEVYLVIRIEKVLQGSIGSCVEPYLKSGDTKKAALKAHKLAEICCKSLGQYAMPFGWAAK